MVQARVLIAQGRLDKATGLLQRLLETTQTGGHTSRTIEVLMLQALAFQAEGIFPRVLNYLGVAIGVAGIISVVPALAEIFIYIFALGQIVWFVWLGIVLLRGRPNAAA